MGTGNRETECFVDMYPKVNHGNFYSSNLKEGTHNNLCPGFDGSLQDSTTKSFHHLMKNIGQALNVSISVHDLPSLLNRIQYEETEDFLQNSPCLSICDHTSGSFQSDGFHTMYECWKEYGKRNIDHPSFNITNLLINYCYGPLNKLENGPMDIRKYMK